MSGYKVNTYSAAVELSLPAGTVLCLEMFGGNDAITLFKRVSISSDGLAVEDWNVTRFSTQAVGVPTAVLVVPNEPRNPAAFTTVRSYVVNPVPGVLIGLVGSVALAAGNSKDYIWGREEAQRMNTRGITDTLCVTHVGGGALIARVEVEFEEGLAL